MNKQEAYSKIKKLIEELGDPDSYMHEDYPLDPNEIKDNPDAELLVGQGSVYHYGGGGQGEDYNTVWHFPNPDIYIRFYGWYASHSGAEYEGMQLVEPKQVLVTQYHTVK